MRSMQSIPVMNVRLRLARPVSTSANLLRPVRHVLLDPRLVQRPIHALVPMVIMVMVLVMVTVFFVSTKTEICIHR